MDAGGRLGRRSQVSPESRQVGEPGTPPMGSRLVVPGSRVGSPAQPQLWAEFSWALTSWSPGSSGRDVGSHLGTGYLLPGAAVTKEHTLGAKSNRKLFFPVPKARSPKTRCAGHAPPQAGVLPTSPSSQGPGQSRAGHVPRAPAPVLTWPLLFWCPSSSVSYMDTCQWT